MGRTSNKTKQDWNARNYTQVKISVKPETASAFKEACGSAGVSMASAISCFMEDFCNIESNKKRYAPDLATRRHRRNALNAALRQLERIRDNEEHYLERIPENLHASDAYDAASQCVDSLNEAIEVLASAY